MARGKFYRKQAKKQAKEAGLPKQQIKAVKALIRAEQSKVIEAKHADYMYEPVPLAGFFHNTWRLMEQDPFTLLQGVQGSENLNPPNRVGDSIFCKYIDYKLILYNFNDRPNLLYRILILKIKPDTPTVSNPTLHPQSVSQIVSPVDYENSQIISVVYDRVINTERNISITSGPTIRDTKTYWSHRLKVNQKIKYEDGANAARNFTYAFWVCAYDTVNSLSTDNVARYTYARRNVYYDA